MGPIYRPPFEISPGILGDCAEILHLVGRHEGASGPSPRPQLRRRNRIRTVQASLAIEGSRLTEDQVAAVLDGKRVVGSEREIREVQNAIAAYEQAARYQPASERALLSCHKLLMRGLLPDAGRYRAGGIGVLRGDRVAHLAPAASQVPRLMAQLLSFVRSDRETHLLVKSAAFHYELEFIHPFSDGNGRIGRLWQHVMLVRLHPVFEAVPVESVVRARQAEYYEALGISDRSGSATAFIEFSLATIRAALEDLSREPEVARPTSTERLALAWNHFATRRFSRREYRVLLRTLSTATASRDLREGVERGDLERSGDKAKARYRFMR